MSDRFAGPLARRGLARRAFVNGALGLGAVGLLAWLGRRR